MQNAVDEMSSLPGIGKRTALRLVLNLLSRENAEVKRFTEALLKLKEEICNCEKCYNISDTPVCSICCDSKRDHSIICVVEDIRDVIAIENTMQFRGVYHVLGGIISPMDGIGPADLKIEELIKRVEQGDCHEIIMALPASMEGDTTNFYIFRRLKDFSVTVSTIARGIAVGGELEYADEITLGRSIINRMPLENTIGIRK